MLTNLAVDLPFFHALVVLTLVLTPRSWSRSQPRAPRYGPIHPTDTPKSSPRWSICWDIFSVRFLDKNEMVGFCSLLRSILKKCNVTSRKHVRGNYIKTTTTKASLLSKVEQRLFSSRELLGGLEIQEMLPPRECLQPQWQQKLCYFLTELRLSSIKLKRKTCVPPKPDFLKTNPTWLHVLILSLFRSWLF